MNHVSVTPVGPFGHAFAECLRVLCRDLEVATVEAAGVEAAGVGAAWQGPQPPGSWLHVLAAWRRVPRLEREFDEESFRSGQPWLPVILDHPVLEIGPAVVPGLGACHGCYRRRIAQHDAARAVTEAITRFYDEHPDAGPAGYLPSTALFAAAVAAEVVERLRVAPDAEAGRVRQLDVPTQQLRSGRVVGVHGCPLCGLGRDETTRSSERLPAMLQEVLR